MLVGSKADLREHQQEGLISHEEIMRKKDELDFKAYVETSARVSNGSAVNDNFSQAVGEHDAFSKVVNAHEAFSQVILMIENDREEKQERQKRQDVSECKD